MKQLSKTLIAALISVGAMTSASAAIKFSGDYGVGTNSYIGLYNGAAFDSAFFDNTTDPAVANPLILGSAFTNVWTFEVTNVGQVAINANFIPTTSIAGFNVKLYSASWTSATANTFTVAGTATGLVLGSLLGDGGTGLQSNIPFTAITPGKYAFVVTGAVTSAPSLYSGQITTTNVPEPTSLALVGLALVGAGAVLRKRNAA